MSESVIHTVATATWTRHGRWRVELEIVGQPKAVHWLSPSQYDYLASAFGHTRHGYSDGRCQVVGEFDENGRYLRWKALALPPKPRHFTPLVTLAEIDHDLLDHD